MVLITTKRGRTGPTRYTLQSTMTFDKVIKTMPLQRKYGLGLDGIPFVCGGVGCAVGGLQNASWGAALAAGTPTFDHGKEIFDTGRTVDNNLSMSGGNDRTTFYLSGGLTAQDGMIVGPNNKYNRASLRLKGTHQLNTQLNVGGNFSYVDTRGKYVQKGSNTSGLLLGALRTPPEFDNTIYLDPDNGLHRSYRYPRPAPGSETRTRSYDNPFFTLNSEGNRSELGRFIGNVNLDYNPLSWLAVKYTLGGDYYNDWRLEALPQSASGFPTGRVVRLDVNNLEIDHNLIATATTSWTPNIGTTLTLGQNLNSRRQRLTSVLGTTLIAPTPLALQNTVSWVPFENTAAAARRVVLRAGDADLYDQLFLTRRNPQRWILDVRRLQAASQLSRRRAWRGSSRTRWGIPIRPASSASESCALRTEKRAASRQSTAPSTPSIEPFSSAPATVISSTPPRAARLASRPISPRETTTSGPSVPARTSTGSTSDS